jgi:hypothetical protein
MRHVKKFWTRKSFLIAVVLTIFVLAGRLMAYPASVRDIIHGSFVEGITVKYPAIYTFFAPVFQLGDRISILSVKQMFILFIYINTLWVVFRGAALFGKSATYRDIPAEIVRFIGINAFVLLCLSLFIFVPRPLPTLVTKDPDIIVLDFHTHTEHSWDGRPSASLSNQIHRRRSGGFDAFFVTDHSNRYSDLEEAAVSALKAGGITPIPLRGEEISVKAFNLMVLGPDIEDPKFYNPNKAQNLLLNNKDNPETLVIATVDVDWWKHPEALDPFVIAGLNGIELAKASPRGLNLTVEDRERMVRYARKNNLIITGASDNHGFGYTDYVWNLLRLPGWRSLEPAQLERAILQEVRQLRPGALTIVTRIKAEPTRNAFLMGIDPLRQVWEMLRSLPGTQAVVFVVYAWIPFILTLLWMVLKPRLAARKGVLLPTFKI